MRKKDIFLEYLFGSWGTANIFSIEPPEGSSGEYGIARQYDPIARKFATVCNEIINYYKPAVMFKGGWFQTDWGTANMFSMEPPEGNSGEYGIARQ